MWEAELRTVIRTILESEEKLRIFRRRYIVGISTNKGNSIKYYLVPYRLSTHSHVTLNDLEWPFCVKFCFAPVRFEL